MENRHLDKLYGKDCTAQYHEDMQALKCENERLQKLLEDKGISVPLISNKHTETDEQGRPMTYWGGSPTQNTGEK